MGVERRPFRTGLRRLRRPGRLPGADDHRRRSTRWPSSGRPLRPIAARPARIGPGQPVFVIDDPPEPGGTGLREATPDDLELLVPGLRGRARGGARQRPAPRRSGRLSLAHADADRRRPIVDLEGERHDPLQGRSLGVDAERHSAPAGLGRSRRRGTRATRSAPCATSCARLLERDPGRVPVRPSRERARDPPLREGRHAPPRQLPERSAVRERVEEPIRRHELIPPGGEVTCLVSGGADSTCLWHVLRALGYRVSALHVDHGLRGRESEEDAALLPRAARRGGRGRRARRPRPRTRCASIRYSFATDRLRATGHTASDQVETVLYRLVASGAAGRDQAEARGRRRPPAARRSGARRRRPTAAPRASPTATDYVQPGHEARPDPRRDPAAAAPAPPRRRRRTSCASRERRGRRRSTSCSRSRRRLEARSTSGRASRPCASTNASGSSKRRSRSRAGPLGPLDDRVRARRP